LDLSHPDTFFFSTGSAPAVPLLTRFDLPMVAEEKARARSESKEERTQAMVKVRVLCGGVRREK
jgi:hypothetical protein